MEKYEVANIEEAVELAYKLKAEGRYNWFRGQVQLWSPFSSYYRVWKSGDSKKKEKSARRHQMFSNWVSMIPKLQYLQEPEHDHDFFAIMQHYGIPTNYIDFTTDPGVAGFFAADTANPPSEDQSCIYCLNTDDLMSLWKIIGDFGLHKEKRLELVEIDVENLWRLQAQEGVFLFSNYNWDFDYPMDRILFPYSGYPSYPTRERIYPEHKSPLEQLLDQYFSLENATFAAEMMRRMSEEMHINYFTAEGLPEGFSTSAFIDPARLIPLESWNREALRPWEIVPEEDYYQTIGPPLKLQLQPRASAEEVRKSVSFGVKQILRSDAAIRSKSVDWVLTGLPESLSPEELNDMIRPVWNGMRRLPYSDSEIADAIGVVTTLLMLGFRKRTGSDTQRELFSQCFGECMLVEFGHQDGSGTRGLAALESLRRSLRSDMAELLLPKYKEYVNNIHDLFHKIYNPRLMFEFNEFKSMFAREIIPSQVVLGRDLLLFNPTQLKVFGLP
jgi:FRG domain